MYIVFENIMTNITTYFALTEEQLKDERSKVLFENGISKEIARVASINEMKNLPTERKIGYTHNGKIKFA